MVSTEITQVRKTKKGNQSHHGMKAHIGVDAESGIVYLLVGTAANVADVTEAEALLHGHETDGFSDAVYQGIEKRAGAEGPQWHIAMRPGKRRLLSDSPVGQMLERVGTIKVSIRARVEHPFHVFRDLFRHRKTRYRGLAKN